MSLLQFIGGIIRKLLIPVNSNLLGFYSTILIMDFSTLSKRLTAARKKRGWTQMQLVAASKVKQSFIGALEAGNQKSSSWLPEIAHALNVDAFWLKTGKGKIPEIFSDCITEQNCMAIEEPQSAYVVNMPNSLQNELATIAAKISDEGLHRLIGQAIQLAQDYPRDLSKTALK